MSQQQPYILAVDTATPCSTVALTSGGRVGGRVHGMLSVSSNVTHSRRLLVAIERLLGDCCIDREQITGFGVGLGPGSFTGLRIGMATVKGLAMAAGKPLYGVSTLDMIAAAVPACDRLICSVLDARKKEVYAAMYRSDGQGLTRQISAPMVLPPEELATHISEPVVLVGDGLFAYRQLWQEQLGELAAIAPVHHWSPSAAILGLLCGEKMDAGESLDPRRAAPLYVRASDAELNLKTPAA